MSRFDGDPYLVMDENGADIPFVGGQPVMDQGFENQANISLFTDGEWFGNILFSDPAEKIGSDFISLSKGSITLSKLNDIRQSAEKALASDSFGRVTTTVENVSGSRLSVTNLIEPPGRDINQIIIEKNGVNWISQKNNPAYKKV